MKTAKELSELIGTVAGYRVRGSNGSIVFQVTVKDAKSAYGQALVLIVPQYEGQGSMWVRADGLVNANTTPKGATA